MAPARRREPTPCEVRTTTSCRRAASSPHFGSHHAQPTHTAGHICTRCTRACIAHVHLSQRESAERCEEGQPTTRHDARSRVSVTGPAQSARQSLTVADDSPHSKRVGTISKILHIHTHHLDSTWSVSSGASSEWFCAGASCIDHEADFTSAHSHPQTIPTGCRMISIVGNSFQLRW